MGQLEQTTRNMLVKPGVVAQHSGSFNRIESSRPVWAACFQAYSGERVGEWRQGRTYIFHQKREGSLIGLTKRRVRCYGLNKMLWIPEGHSAEMMLVPMWRQ